MREPQAASPFAAMLAQRFAVSESNKGGAVVHLLRHIDGLLEILCFREEREPAGKGLTIRFTIEPEEVRRSIVRKVRRRCDSIGTQAHGSRSGRRLLPARYNTRQRDREGTANRSNRQAVSLVCLHCHWLERTIL